MRFRLSTIARNEALVCDKKVTLKRNCAGDLANFDLATVQPPLAVRLRPWGLRDMSFRFQSVRLQVETPRVLDSKPSLLSPGLWNFVRLFAVVLTGAARAQSSVVTNKTALRSPNRQTSSAAVSTRRHFPHSTCTRVTVRRNLMGLPAFIRRDRKPLAAKTAGRRIGIFERSVAKVRMDVVQ
jgi:hypothetical protein